MKRDLKIVDSMLELIGDIPLVRLNRIGREYGSEILVKPEFLNPSGSIKDRVARRMIEDAEAERALGSGATILEATTGNTGTALAFVSAVKGYHMVAISPEEAANKSRASIMQAYGCEVRVVPAVSGQENASKGLHGARVEILPRQLCRDLEGQQAGFWWARQFANPSNPAAHRDGTAREILEMTGGQLDVFVASVGTGGTLLGVAEVLKAHDPGIMVVGVEPASYPILARPDQYSFLPGISDGIIPEILDRGLVDRVLTVKDAEAVQMAHELAEREGVFAGISSGANVVACLRMAAELPPGRRIVTVMPDSRDRYLEVEVYST
jgi:cysteine synthase A